MHYIPHESDQAVRLEPASPADAAVLWLHGLGADGYDFVPIVSELALPPAAAVRFIFPHAAYRPVTINNGYVMRAWYDIAGFGAQHAEDAAGIRASESVLRTYLDAERRAGIAAERIVVAGFSQGGAMALHTALRYPERLAGVMALSTYLPLRAELQREATAANRDVPILMCHGERDSVVPLTAGAMSRDVLRAAGYQVEWRSYAMEHQVMPQEIVDIGAWLGRLLGTNSAPAA